MKTKLAQADEQEPAVATISEIRESGEVRLGAWQVVQFKRKQKTGGSLRLMTQVFELSHHAPMFGLVEVATFFCDKADIEGEIRDYVKTDNLDPKGAVDLYRFVKGLIEHAKAR